jgi:hypothetical protein
VKLKALTGRLPIQLALTEISLRMFPKIRGLFVKKTEIIFFPNLRFYINGINV